MLSALRLAGRIGDAHYDSARRLLLGAARQAGGDPDAYGRLCHRFLSPDATPEALAEYGAGPAQT
eukprot:gene12961-7898_t